ncbi:MAG: signal recognition particle-docking protein FtsY [Actinobacteria bacterium]|mgnify:FL=1|jgi:fused signal recognition particle receptor|nr:signal recognition particle-docking protein FtsY [Actinomycetota bacterium]MBT3745440.1 signal recognition particle-docking protein FtsY [Actinomycetota bacterium]MBT3970452.1 signal recognition particle-docking protein FtsY [Actinomycetota bacterium]MBT4010347.1 signal recognition particle-docking protein FtsY [Actinomycetota bacterium]MBT4303693.1 signal recognition particle-docking protein FtsY [Actinomycetota bacterium]
MSLRNKLGKPRASFSDRLGGFRSRPQVDQAVWDELEEALLGADVGLPTTSSLLEQVRRQAEKDSVVDPEEVLNLLRKEMVRFFQDADLELNRSGAPSVWLFVGVNGVGKTTTIGKLTHREITAGRSVVLAAGDTFRAAAVEQLTQWGNRSEVTIISGAEGSDPSSVIFDAVEHAAARGSDLVLADTAGRVHTKSNLMDELRKVRRVAEKGAGTVTETLLVLDATTGQNGLMQAKQFTEAAEVTGVVLTKLDGSARGGIVLAIQSELGIPVKLVGVGESIEDLMIFEPTAFVDALFG